MNFGVFTYLNNTQQQENPLPRSVTWMNLQLECWAQVAYTLKGYILCDSTYTCFSTPFFRSSQLSAFSEKRKLPYFSFVMKLFFFSLPCPPHRGCWGAWEGRRRLVCGSISAPTASASFQDPDAEEAGGEQGEHRGGTRCHRKFCFQFSTRYESLGR